MIRLFIVNIKWSDEELEDAKIANDAEDLWYIILVQKIYKAKIKKMFRKSNYTHRIKDNNLSQVI